MTKKGSVGLNLGIGAAIGYGASWVMDQATGWYLERQSKTSRRREDEIEPGGTPVLAGRKLASWVGRDVADDEAARIGFIVHRSLGVAYGMTAAALARTGARPVRAGITTGAAAFVLVDEGVVSTLFTPPPWAYPIESHLRGAIGHLAYGAAAGAMLAATHRLGALGS
jgi:hypothetical protein